MIMSKDIYSIFYNPTKALSYNRPYIFSVGARSIGKSTGWKIHLLLEFLRHKKKFIYVRRTEDELKLSRTHFFDNASLIISRYTGEPCSVEYKGLAGYYVNGEQAGYAVPLARQGKYKSATEFEDVFYILYDEFLMTPGSTRYLSSGGFFEECDCMTFLYQTVDRGIDKAYRNETKVIFLGNAGKIYNPFFLKYGVDRYLREDTKYLAPKNNKDGNGPCLWVCEQTSETEATREIMNSYAYQLSGESAREYAYDNKYADIIKSDFIMKKPAVSWEPIVNLAMDGNVYGTYAFPEEGLIYVSHRPAPGRQTFALTTADHTPNYMLIRKYSGHIFMSQIKRMYDLGMCRYQDQKCQYVLDFFFGNVI